MALDKYLARHADAQARTLPALSGRWPSVVVMPVRDEGPECLDAVRELPRSLLVLVANQVEGAATTAEAKLFAALGGRAPESVHLVRRSSGADVLLIDRASEGRQIARGWGVGAARKLGSDVALALWRAGQIESDWIHFTDADASLPADHLDDLPTDALARVATFRHVDAGEPEVAKATLRYEIGLRHYVLGLRHARSAFAHHSIGSLISVRADAYAQVRGVPPREAGEDFYFLDKLRKQGRVETRSRSPVHIRARRSARAPFGTGPAVRRLIAGEVWTLYDLACFDALREWLDGLRMLAEGGSLDSTLAGLSEEVRRAAEPWIPMVKKVVSNYPQTQLETRLRNTFSGLPTLRFIHAFRDQGYPNLSREALHAPWFTNTGHLDEPALRDHLATFESGPV